MGFDYGGATKGALGGATIGGSFGGPAGAVIGGAAGGLLGGFGGGGQYEPNRSAFDVHRFSPQYNQYSAMQQQYGGREAPRVGESHFRAFQASLAKELYKESLGKGVGQKLVRMQAQQAADQAMRQQLALAQGAAPGGGAAAARSAALAGGQAQSAVGGQAAQAGLQAQLGAMGMLGSVAEQGRSQDYQLGGMNADLTLRNRSINDQASLEALRQRLQLSQMQQQGAMGYEQLRAGQAPQMGAGDMLMGLGMGAGQAGMLRGLGGGQGQQPYNGQGWSNGSAGYGYQPFNPMRY